MTALEATPADWLRGVLLKQEGVRAADFDVPPHADRIVLVTSSGQRLLVSIGTEEDLWEWNDD